MAQTLNINGKTIRASMGDTLVDAALAEGILIPHDCATGQCETCRVRVAYGTVDDNGTGYGDTVLACQARIAGDLAITMEDVPAAVVEKGVVERISPLGPRVVELAIRLRNTFAYRPGQYATLAFNGFPARDYSISAPMKGPIEPDLLVFQIRILPDGLISTALGKTIDIGHSVRVSGPHGSAYLRQQEEGPLILAASGTGFGPIWALARAATIADRERPLQLIAGIRTPDDAYMQPALHWLRDNGRENIVLTSKQAAQEKTLNDFELREGEADLHLNTLDDETSVHVAGNPAMVDRVKERALKARARCYADPFNPSTNQATLGHRFAKQSRNLGRFFSPRRHR